MRKANINLGWIALIIPLGILIFVVAPGIYEKYQQFDNKQTKHQKNIVLLDSLKTLPQPTQSDLNQIKRLQIHVDVGQTTLTKQKFEYLKIGGMLVVLAGMFLSMFGSNLWLKRKKNAPTNTRITFNYEDPNTDPIGQQISWESLQNGGSNFLSERLKKRSYGYLISASGMLKAMAWAFLLIGLNWLVWTYVETYTFKPDTLDFMTIGGIFFTSGGPFLLVGLFLTLMSSAKAVIHMRKRTVIAGGERLPFNQIHALQVLQKFVQGSSSGGYFCYELNVVTKNGARHNLLNHGDKTYLLSDTVKISRILRVPVWNMGVV